MATTDTNLADRSGSLVESYKNYDPRIIFFYFLITALLITLMAGLAYQQLSKSGEHANAERQQNQRRILVPGPRGNIYDRNHKLLVGNRPRFSVRLMVDQIRPEILREYRLIRKNYRAAGDADLPTVEQMARLARIAVVQRYLNEVNRITGRVEKVDGDRLMKHLQRELLLPFTLIDDLAPEEYARLLEKLPVNSPTQVYTSSTRLYPHGAAASHALGYVGSTEEIEAEDIPGGDLKTFKVKGTMGRQGIEKQFDELLQGEAGGEIFRVDPAGNRILPPIERVLPKQGGDLTLSLDIELQLAAEQALAHTEMAGSAVAIDVATGEVLVLTSKPDYDLAQFSPRISAETWADANQRGALFPRAMSGTYQPGSSFKILTTIAGLRSGAITPESTFNCPGFFIVGNRSFKCHDGHAHGEIGLVTAIEKSCNVFYYKHGIDIGPDALAAEGRRFHLDRPTGIELPFETAGSVMPDEAWKRKHRPHDGPWTRGDTALSAIGQGYVLVTPLQMACFTASVARDEVWTQPTLLHQPNRPTQRHEKIGLTPEQRQVLLRGMEQVTLTGTARILTAGRVLPVLPGLRIGAKTGTAQNRTDKGMINFAWLIAFAPVENPQIAIAVAIEGDTPGEETGGGLYASPVAHAILRTWLEQKTQPKVPPAAQRIKLKTD